MSDLDKINTHSERKIRVLIAPLDWGLGHTTRCLPIIYELTRQGADVCVACNERQARLIQSDIPNARILTLAGYNFRYSKRAALNKLATIFQAPKVLTAIKQENRWLENVLKNESFDIIISDNRYGFHNPSVYSIFLTHQLQIQVPFNKWLQRILQKWNYRFINRFDECWIPDFESEPNLAGELSHPNVFPNIPVKYLGLLSRFHEMIGDIQNSLDILALISGPEPQRTILEEKILDQLEKIQNPTVVVRGLPESTITRKDTNHVSFFNHLPTEKLNQLMLRAGIIVSRSGYSTVMDVICLRKKTVLVPTPGQTEQEYLADHLMKKKWCLSMPQKNFSLEAALEKAAAFQYAIIPTFKDLRLREIISEVMNKIKNNQRR